MLNPWTGHSNPLTAFHSNPLTAFRMIGLSLGRRNVFLCKYGNTSFASIAPVSFRLRLVQHPPVAKGTLSPCWIFMSWRQDISMFVFSASFKNFQPWASFSCQIESSTKSVCFRLLWWQRPGCGSTPSSVRSCCHRPGPHFSGTLSSSRCFMVSWYLLGFRFL